MQVVEPVEHSELSPKAMSPLKYHELCQRFGLLPIEDGYGLLHCVGQPDGQHWTRLTTDIEFHRQLVARTDTDDGSWEYGPELTEKYAMARPGWPDEWK